MKFILLTALVISLSIFFINNDVFADEKTIIILPNAINPECVDDNTCFTPMTTYLEVGDSIKMEIQSKGSMWDRWMEIDPTIREVGNQSILGPFEEPGVYYFSNVVRPWLIVKVVVGITNAPEQSYEESKAIANKIQQDIVEEQEIIELSRANDYIEELKEKMQNLIDVVSDLEFKIEKLTIQNNNLRNQLEEQLDNNVETINEKKSVAGFVDKEKNPQSYIDRYNNEESYREWFHENYPDYKSIHEAVGKREPVPNWIKNNAKWWAEGQISEDEFVNGIEYLVKQKIVDVN